MPTTVLVVDDEPTVLSFVRRTLEKEGYDVLCAANGAVAAEICSNPNEEISAVVTDIQMPVIGGRELAKIVANSRSDIPILFMTGYILESECRDHLTGDVRLDGHLIVRKPFRGEVIAAAVGKLLRSKTLQAGV